MGWLDRFAIAFGKEVAKEVSMSPRQKERRRKQEEVNQLERDLGVELTYVESYTQEEYNSHIKRERENSIEALHREGARLVNRLQVFADHYLAKDISLAEMLDAYENAEKTLFSYMLQEMDSKGLSYEETLEIVRQYHDKIFEIKSAIRL